MTKTNKNVHVPRAFTSHGRKQTTNEHSLGSSEIFSVLLLDCSQQDYVTI